MWRLQASAFSLHMLDVFGTEILLGLFVMFSTEQFHYTCLSVVVATQKNRMKGPWIIGH
jgi:hypothetical protein